MGGREELSAAAEASTGEVAQFPRDGFILNDFLCRAPSADGQSLCFRNHGHDGDHDMAPWQGCWVRVPIGRGIVRFGGFAW